MATTVSNQPAVFRTNFASGVHDRVRLINGALYLAAVAGFIAAAISAWGSLEDRRQLAAMQENLVRVQHQSGRLSADLQTVGFAARNPGAAEDLRKRVAALNLVLEHKAFSWSTFLTDLEAAVPSAVSIAGIQPELREGKVNLIGKALTLQDLTKFMIALEEGPRFTDIFLKQQKATDDGSVEFSIQCRYRGG